MWLWLIIYATRRVEPDSFAPYSVTPNRPKMQLKFVHANARVFICFAFNDVFTHFINLLDGKCECASVSHPTFRSAGVCQRVS